MEHAWCLDPSRDERVRAAEDGRDRPLPTLGEAIAAPFACPACGGIGMDHRCKESCEQCDGSGRAIIPKTGSSSSAPDHENKGDGMATDGMRTERITLEVTHYGPESAAGWEWKYHIRPRHIFESVRVVEDEERDATVGENEPWQKAILNDAVSIIVDGGDWGRGNSMDHGKLGAAVIWADKEIGRLRSRVAVMEEARKRFDTALEEARDASGINDFIVQRDEAFDERDAAIRERDELRKSWLRSEESGTRLLAQRNAALEDADALRKRAAKLEAASGGAEGEPDAFGVVRNGNVDAVTHRLFRKDAERSAEQWGGTLVPLYRQPPQPRGWLTGVEREAVQWAADAAYDKQHPAEDTLRSVLARSTPPEVVLPCSWKTIQGELVCLHREVIAALAAAGVAVEEVGK